MEPERIMVIESNMSPGVSVMSTFTHTEESFFELLLSEAKALPRTALLEQDPTYWQIIPYVVLTMGANNMADNVLVAERLAGGNESRLHGTLTAGFGGHVKYDDNHNAIDALRMSIADELREELGLRVEALEETDLRFIGTFVDGSNQVGQVHYCVLYHLHLDPKQATGVVAGEPDKLRLFWANAAMLPLLHDRLESWAAIALQVTGLTRKDQ